MLKAIIMDFDGVIVDTEVVWYEIIRSWLWKNKKYELSIQEFLVCVGANVKDLLDLLKREHDIDIIEEEFRRDTQISFQEHSSFLPAKCGVATFIESVKREGLKLALATSSTRLKPLNHLYRLKLVDKFDEIISAEDVRRIKPYPDLFLKAAQKLDVKADEVLIIEDSINGLVAGKNAKMRVLVVPNEITRCCDFTGCYKKMDALDDLDVKEIIRCF